MKNQIFKNEASMQKWLRDKLESSKSLNDLIDDLESFKEYKPSGLCETKITNSFKYCLESLDIVEVITDNENISLNPEDSLKPDFLLYAPETQSIVIVELKNLSSPSRQAGTEVSAYANEVKTYIPFISDGDIINVIISPEWAVLLKHYVFHEIFWQQRNILCLQPKIKDDEVRLEIVDTHLIAEDFNNSKLGNEHLGGCNICLYDYDSHTNQRNLTRLDLYINQMKTAMAAMAAKANSQRNHGFAFLWKEKYLTQAPYNITVVNFAPFQSFERHFHTDGFTPNKMGKKLIDIITNHQPEGHGKSLTAILEMCKDVLENICSPQPEGFLNWGKLKEKMPKGGDLISFHCWGTFEEIYTERLIHHYKTETDRIRYDDPGFGLEMLEELVDKNYAHIELSSICREEEDYGNENEIDNEYSESGNDIPF